MRLLAVIGAVLILAIVGAAAYVYLGYYDIAARNPHLEIVVRALDVARQRSVERYAAEQVGAAPALDNPEFLRDGAGHFVEACVICHGAPGRPRAEFAEQMRPRPPDLSKTAPQWSDAELFWMMKKRYQADRHAGLRGNPQR